MRVAPWVCVAVAALVSVPGARAEGDGLSTSADRVPWARFDARVVDTPSWRADLAPFERSGLRLDRRVNVFGDVYFGRGSAVVRAATGGFRATSGLVVGARPALAIADPALAEAATVPYLGVGYSNIWPKSGWRFNADLGVVSQSPGGATGIGRVIGGSQTLDELVRDMRLAPLVQLGVSYSF